jgi:2-succinyl-6-hydroxy-2,4-cyclohexadiene-1-carboxylate synthase
MPYYHSGKSKLHYQEQGTGPALILIHGFRQDSSAWIDVLPTYSQFFRVLAVDMRGCGLSEGTEPGYVAKDIAFDVVALMDHLKLETAHVSGYSLGGCIALEMGIATPERVSTLSLHSTTAGGSIPSLDRWLELRRRVIMSGDTELDLATRLFSFFSPNFMNEHGDRVEAFLKRERESGTKFSPTGIPGQAHIGATFNARDRLHMIKAPTLITVGGADRTTLPSQSRELKNQIPHAEFVIVDGAGHFTMYECTEEFASISLGFLIKHSKNLTRRAA